MGKIKDRKGKDFIETKEIKKRWKAYTKEKYEKDLNDLDNQDGVVSHSEPDILECEVKWALGSNAANKASEGDEIPADLLKILKDNAIKVLTVYQQIWKTHPWPQDWKRSVLIPIPKKGSTKECSNQWTVALISHSSKIMLTVLHTSLQHVNWKHAGVQAGFRKGWGFRGQNANIFWVIEKAREFQKNIYICFIDYAKAFDCMDHNKLWKTLKEMGILDHLTCLLRNLYVGQEATVRTPYGTLGWFKIEKGVQQGCLLLPCLFILYAECVVQNARLDELQAEIKIAGGNINNLRYVDDITLMAESKEEPKNLLMKVKEES